MSKTLVGAPDHFDVRKSRLAWIASTIVLPLYRTRQAVRKVKR